jgi:hypothetical protein
LNEKVNQLIKKFRNTGIMEGDDVFQVYVEDVEVLTKYQSILTTSTKKERAIDF